VCGSPQQRRNIIQPFLFKPKASAAEGDTGMDLFYSSPTKKFPIPLWSVKREDPALLVPVFIQI